MSEFDDVLDIDYLNEGSDHDPEDIDEIDDDLGPQIHHSEMAAEIIESLVGIDTECDEVVETEYDGSLATDVDGEGEDDDECEEPSHPDTPNPPIPDLEEIAEIVAAVVETATAPLLEQIESQQCSINELTTAIGAIDIEQAIDGLATVVEGIDQHSASAIKRLVGMCDRLDTTLSHAQSDVRSAILSNESATVQRQRAMMNFFLARSSLDKRNAAIKEFCTSGELIEEHGIEARILVNPKPWARR